MKRRKSRAEALRRLQDLLLDIELHVDVVLAEGNRDVEALRSLGFDGVIEMCSQIGIQDSDLTETISQKYEKALILTDFDEEGQKMNQRLSLLLERQGVTVEKGLRHLFGKMMAEIGVYAIESLDNVKDRFEKGFLERRN